MWRSCTHNKNLVGFSCWIRPDYIFLAVVFPLGLVSINGLICFLMILDRLFPQLCFKKTTAKQVEKLFIPLFVSFRWSIRNNLLKSTDLLPKGLRPTRVSEGSNEANYGLWALRSLFQIHRNVSPMKKKFLISIWFVRFLKMHLIPVESSRESEGK